MSSESSPGVVSSDDEWELTTVFDSIKFIAEHEESAESGTDSEDSSDLLFVSDLDRAAAIHARTRLIDLAIRLGDNPSDETWLPPRQMKEAARRKERPKVYKKGPDVGSKSARTRRRYKTVLQNQTKLTTLGFTRTPQPSAPPQSPPNSEITHSPGPVASMDSIPDMRELTSCDAADVSGGSGTCGLPSESDEDVDEVRTVQLESGNISGPHYDQNDLDNIGATATAGLAHAAEEEWEEELEECERGGIEVRGWDELREQLKEDLTKGSKTLPLSQVNQLLLIRNFATLQLKGLGRIKASLEIARQWHEGQGLHFARKIRTLARHYQVFEQLPIEKRGGRANALSPLKDERLQLAAREWLTSQAIGQVTPKEFRHVLNNTILPLLGIDLPKGLCERTARRWLLKLGWRRMCLRKGVYMDGHERDDVKKYRQEVFLPAMAAYESRMVHFEGPELQRIEPLLQDGEKRIIANFHDECCFHVNDFKTHA